MGSWLTKRMHEEGFDTPPARPNNVRILKGDPRSPTFDVNRTPIAVLSSPHSRRSSCSQLNLSTSNPTSPLGSPLHSTEHPLSPRFDSDAPANLEQSPPPAPLSNVRRTHSMPNDLHRKVLLHNMVRASKQRQNEQMELFTKLQLISDHEASSEDVGGTGDTDTAELASMTSSTMSGDTLSMTSSAPRGQHDDAPPLMTSSVPPEKSGKPPMASTPACQKSTAPQLSTVEHQISGTPVLNCGLQKRHVGGDGIKKTLLAEGI